MPLVIGSEIVKVWNMWGIYLFWIAMHSPFDIYYTHKKWQKNDNCFLGEINVKNNINIYKIVLKRQLTSLKQEWTLGLQEEYVVQSFFILNFID